MNMEELIYDYIAGEISDEQFAELRRWLNESPDHPIFFAQFIADDRAISRHLQHDHAMAGLELPRVVADSGLDGPRNESDLLESLAQMEIAAKGTVVEMTTEQHDAKPARRNTRGLSLNTNSSGHPHVLVIPWAAVWSAAAAVILLAVWTGWLIIGDGKTADDDLAVESTGPEDTAPQNATIAMVDYAIDAQWADGRGPVNGKLAPGQYTLEQGMVRLKYTNGVTAVLQAPSEVRIEDAMRLDMQRGRLSVMVADERGHGFTVMAQGVEVIDYGTEFGVVADPNGGVQTHVYQGRISSRRVDEQASDNAVFLGKGEALSFSDDRGAQKIPANDVAVVRQAEFDTRVRASEGSAYDKWLVSTYELRRDPDMLAYYLFDQDDSERGVLINQAHQTYGAFDGVFGWRQNPRSAPEVGADRWGGRSALRFTSEQIDVVRVPAASATGLDHLDTFTIAAWVKPSELAGISHHLITKRDWQSDALNFVLMREGQLPEDRKNTLLFNVHADRSGLKYTEHQATEHVMPQQSRWVHVAVTFDRGYRMFYVDGQLVDSKRRNGAAAIPANNAELIIGGTTVHINESRTFLDGEVDELFILGRVMTPDDISTLHEQGVPTDEL